MLPPSGDARADPVVIATFPWLFDLPEPSKVSLVALTLNGLRRERALAQRQVRPLRWSATCLQTVLIAAES